MKSKIILITLLALIAWSGFSQDDKNPCRWFKEGTAKNAKSYLSDYDLITYYPCQTSANAKTIQVKKIIVKPSTTGEGYFDLFIVGKDQNDQKEEWRVFLDDVWVKEGNEYINLADCLGIERENCSVEEVKQYFGK